MNSIVPCNHDVACHIITAAKAALLVVRFLTNDRGKPYVDGFVADLRSSLGGKSMDDALPIITREIISNNTSYEEALLTLAAIATIIDESTPEGTD